MRLHRSIRRHQRGIPDIKAKVFDGRRGLGLAAKRACLEALERGGVIVIPTDTVYGLACGAFNPEAIAAVYRLKGRSYAKPLPILLAGAEQLPLVADAPPPEANRLIKRYWPGPLTLVLKTTPLALHASRGRATLAVRVPDHGIVRDVLVAAAIPLAATSANRSGEPSITDGAQAVRAFGGLVDVIIDAGRCAWSKESSVVDATHYPFTLLREGAVTKSELDRELFGAP